MSADTSPKAAMPSAGRRRLERVLAAAICLFTLAEVNYPTLRPQSQLALFALLGLMLCFLLFPARQSGGLGSRFFDRALLVLTPLICGYMVVQNEPLFARWWLSAQSLGERAGIEHGLDYVVGTIGLLLVLEAARRTVGWALPCLALLFLAYAHFGRHLPDFLFPHRGYGLERIVGQTFLHSQGVFGIALKVMFTYVFLFVLFGALLEATGATRFVLEAARRLFRDSPAAPAKVAVLSSGLMGSLSGSAVANTATTGTFTIPLMRSAGFRPHIAAGLEAAASSGGALVPPVMGAGAYMMLEIIDPPVTFLQIVRAALLPALLYYLTLFLIVHLQGLKIAAGGGKSDVDHEPAAQGETNAFAGWVFASGLLALIGFLLRGFTVFRSVSLAIVVVIAVAAFDHRSRLTVKRLIAALERTARGGVALVAAAASVGIILGVVTLTGIGSKLPATLLPLAQENLFLALLLLMVSSLVLGMGLPSAVCYLLLATLVGPALSGLGVAPLAAHLFIFYFGLMSMVTPPVALAAYTAASIANTGIMRTALAAFRFSLAGFVLPFVFVFRPALLMLEGSSLAQTALTLLLTGLGLFPLAAAIAGYLRGTLGPLARGLLLLASALILWPPGVGALIGSSLSLPNLSGLALLTACVAHRGRKIHA